KIFKGFAIFLSVVFVVVYLMIALLNTTIVQSFTAAKVAEFFSKQWNTKVSIGSLNVSPFLHAGVKDVYVEDLQQDTLAYISFIGANLSNIKSAKHIVVRNVEIKDITCHLSNSDKGMNFKFIIDYFKSDKKKEEKEQKEPFVLEIRKIDLSDINFKLKNLKNKTSIEEHLFASNDIEVSSSYLRAKNFVLSGGDINLEIEHLSLKERSGLNLKKLKGKVRVSPQNIYLKESEIITDNTNFKTDINLYSNTYKTYSSFVDSVYMQISTSQDSYVGMQDAAYFAKQLQGAKQRVFTFFNLKGTLSNLTINNLDVRSNNTQLKTYGSIKGLVDIENTFADLRIENLNTSYEDVLNQSLGFINEKIPNVDLLKRLGNVMLKGEFRGKIKDFVSKANIISDIGVVDVEAESKPKANSTLYLAKIESNGVNLSKLLNNNMLGTTSLNADASIVWNKNYRNGELFANLHNFYFKDNIYDQVQVEGKLNDYDIDLDLNIKDKYADLKAKGQINYQNKPSIVLDAQASQVDLHNMNLYSFADTNTILSADIFANIQNFDLDSLNGEVRIKH
ncbi:MAG: hypothetical protein Q4Q06_08170, partial [Bacteroidota bacterium]|nr:hypothetical protein [Bacteroidota bacterium]